MRHIPMLLCATMLLLAGCAGYTEQVVPLRDEMTNERLAPYAYGGPLLDARAAGAGPTKSSVVKDTFSKAAYILIGEAHTSELDHAGQARLLRELAEAGLSPVLGMEMIDRDRQSALNHFNAGMAPVDSLPGALDWRRTVGFPFSLYRPVFAVAGQYRIPVYGLNLPSEMVKAARLKGLDGFSKAQKKTLPERVILSPQAQREYLAKVFNQHFRLRAISTTKKTGKPAAGMPRLDKPAEEKMLLDRFILAQSLWDSTMAETAVRLHRKTGRPVVIMAGYAHVEHGWGIAGRIRELDPAAPVLTVLPWRGGADERAAGEASAANANPAADYFFFSPDTPLAASASGLLLGGAAPVAANGKAGGMNGMAPGVAVQDVKSFSAAALSGFEKGDVIVAVKDEPVTGPEQLLNLLARYQAYGIPAKLDVLRNGKRRALTLRADW